MSFLHYILKNIHFYSFCDKQFIESDENKPEILYNG